VSKIGKSEHATLYQSERPAKNEIILAIHPASLFPCFTESQEPGHKGPAFAGKQPLWRVLSCANFPAAFRDVDLTRLSSVRLSNRSDWNGSACRRHAKFSRLTKLGHDRARFLLRI